MKKINKIVLLCSVLLITFFSCKDDSLQVIPEWGTGVNTYTTRKAGSVTGFENGNATVPMNLNFRWISIDGLNTVTKIEFFLLFNESYVDLDGNPKTVRHGGTAGKLFKTIEGAAVPANRTDVAVNITMADVYALYKDNTYNYCGASVPVFNNLLKPGRTTAVPFIPGDTFSLKWIVYTADGRKFDSWSPSVCTEFPGSNCVYSWGLNCISNLAGTYTYENTNMKGGGEDFPGTLTGSGTLTSTSTGKYQFSDFSFGINENYWGESEGTKGSVNLVDACGFLSYTGVDQYGAAYGVYTITLISVTPTVLTFKWSNSGGDEGTTAVTRTDSKTWPANLTTTPSGSCN